MKFYLKIQKTVLHFAADNGNIEIIQILLKNKNMDINSLQIQNSKNFKYSF